MLFTGVRSFFLSLSLSFALDRYNYFHLLIVQRILKERKNRYEEKK